MKIETTAKYLLSLALIFCLNSAWAHSFNILYIAPFSDPAGQSALRGFLLATGEEDAHEAEESDGHLGGLDSYIFKLDHMPGEAPGTEQLGIMVQENEFLFAAGIISDTRKKMLEDNGIVVVNPVSSNFWAASIAHPAQIKLINGGGFSSAFEAVSGYPPDLQAIQGYLTARIIAAVVRNADQQTLSSPGELTKAVELVLQKSAL